MSKPNSFLSDCIWAVNGAVAASTRNYPIQIGKNPFDVHALVLADLLHDPESPDSDVRKTLPEHGLDRNPVARNY